jgi:hypothetical protein
LTAILQFFSFVLLASVRLLMTPPVAFLAGMSFWETLAAVNTGGLIGFVFFYFMSDLISLKPNRKKNAITSSKRIKKIRRILVYRNRVGPWPFILTSPFLSVPVSAFIIRKLYPRSFKVLIFSLLTICFWGSLSCLLFSPVSLFST